MGYSLLNSQSCFKLPKNLSTLNAVIFILFFSHIQRTPSADIDSAWDPIREFVKGLKASSFHSEWNEKALQEIMATQKAKIKELKLAKSKKPLPQCLTIIDDFADRADIMHASGNIMTTLFFRGRHFGSSCWLSSQKLTAISTVARVNFRFMLCWRLRNQREVLSLLEELSAVYPIDVLHQMYETAISDADHSFWYINLVAKKKDDMFHIRFEHKMQLEDE